MRFEANNAYGSKTQDERQRILMTGIENMQNNPHNYEQKQTYSAGENTTKIVIRGIFLGLITSTVITHRINNYNTVQTVK